VPLMRVSRAWPVCLSVLSPGCVRPTHESGSSEACVGHVDPGETTAKDPPNGSQAHRALQIPMAESCAQSSKPGVQSPPRSPPVLHAGQTRPGCCCARAHPPLPPSPPPPPAARQQHAARHHVLMLRHVRRRQHPGLPPQAARGGGQGVPCAGLPGRGAADGAARETRPAGGHGAAVNAKSGLIGGHNAAVEQVDGMQKHDPLVGPCAVPAA